MSNELYDRKPRICTLIGILLCILLVSVGCSEEKAVPSVPFAPFLVYQNGSVHLIDGDKPRSAETMEQLPDSFTLETDLLSNAEVQIGPFTYIVLLEASRLSCLLSSYKVSEDERNTKVRVKLIKGSAHIAHSSPNRSSTLVVQDGRIEVTSTDTIVSLRRSIVRGNERDIIYIMEGSVKLRSKTIIKSELRDKDISDGVISSQGALYADGSDELYLRAIPAKMKYYLKEVYSIEFLGYPDIRPDIMQKKSE